MTSKKKSPIKKVASTAKKQAKKATTAGKTVVAKVKRTARSAAKTASSTRTKAATVVHTEKKKVVATAESVRGKAKKLVSKAQKFGHDASDVAVRIGSTMETIGGAILSIVKPAETTSERKQH